MLSLLREKGILVELYRKHRPKKFKQVVGQDDAVKTLMDLVKRDSVPHALLFQGPSGCGKTTLARILRKKLGCSDEDFREINAADSRGIDMVRDIRQKVGLAPLTGECRVWLIDEAAQLTTQAQDSFLKLLEDTPSHVYFMLATTDPQKLKRTIITRCTQIKLGLIPDKVISGLVKDVCAKVSSNLTREVLDKIVDIAEGSARKALVLLHQVIGLDSEEDQLAALAKADSKRQAIELCRLLLGGSLWPEIVKVLKDVDDEPESLRRMVLGYVSKVCLGGRTTQRAVEIMNCFLDNFYDSGKAGLIVACWNAKD